MTETINGQEALKRVFEIIQEEAKRNPKFMENLLQALPPGIVVQIEQREKRTPKLIDELIDINPIEVIEKNGSAKLSELIASCSKKKPLVDLAKRYRLDVPLTVQKGTANLSVMKEQIVAAAAKKVKNARLLGG